MTQIKDDSFWTKVQAIYFHSVCFFSIIMIVIGSIMFSTNLLKIVLKIKDPWTQSVTIDVYDTKREVDNEKSMLTPKTFSIERAEFCIANQTDKKCNLTDEQVTTLEARFKEAVDGEKYRIYNEFISAFSFILVGLIFYFFHRKKLKN